MNEYKGRLQAKCVYRGSVNDEKFSDYKNKFNSINSVLKVRKELDQALDYEISRFGEQVQGLVINTSQKKLPLGAISDSLLASC